MSIEVRPARHDEADDYLRAVWRGFHNVETDERDLALRRERFLENRWWAAFDGPAIVTTVRTLPLATTMVGGTTLTSCGITAVTTAASHRRQGLMEQALLGALRDGREREEPLTTLIAAEWPIYGRYGYGPASESAGYRIDTSGLRWRYEGEGSVEIVDADTVLALGRAVYERHRRTMPTENDRDDTVMRQFLCGMPSDPFKGFYAVCRDRAGAVSGYVLYKIEDRWEHRRPVNVLEVEELLAVDAAAEARLWRYLCEIDWVATVKAGDRRTDEPLRHWLHDGRAVAQTDRYDFLWARPLDVAACLSARTYAAPLALTIEVDDPLGLSDGRFRLMADGGHQRGDCRPTTLTPDVTVPISTLGAVLFGGTSWSVLHRAGQVSEHAAGSVAAADASFHTATAPWSCTMF